MKRPKAPEIRFKVSNGEEVVFNKKRPSTPKTMDSHDAQIWILNDIRLSSQGRGLYFLDPYVTWAELSVGVVDKKELRKLRAAQPPICDYETCPLQELTKEARAEGMAQGAKQAYATVEKMMLANKGYSEIIRAIREAQKQVKE